MARKILYGSLIGLSVILTVLSLVGIGAAWAYNEPLTRLGLARLNEIDQELGQAQTTLQSAELELERAVRRPRPPIGRESCVQTRSCRPPRLPCHPG